MHSVYACARIVCGHLKTVKVLIDASEALKNSEIKQGRGTHNTDGLCRWAVPAQQSSTCRQQTGLLAPLREDMFLDLFSWPTAVHPDVALARPRRTLCPVALLP